jgi:transketolase C-terminal domain/subunit
VNDRFGESGEAAELFQKYGLTAAKIEEAAVAVRKPSS